MPTFFIIVGDAPLQHLNETTALLDTCNNAMRCGSHWQAGLATPACPPACQLCTLPCARRCLAVMHSYHMKREVGCSRMQAALCMRRLDRSAQPSGWRWRFRVATAQWRQLGSQAACNRSALHPHSD